jgi:hypothetical protein
MPNGWRHAEDRINKARRRAQKHAPRKRMLKGKDQINVYLAKVR